MPSADGLPRHARVAPSLENGHVSFRYDEGASVFSPAAAYLRTLERRARRPSLNASRSGEMEVRPLLCAGHCPSTSATTSNDARARPRASDPRPPRHEDSSFRRESVPTRRPPPSVRVFRRARCAIALSLPREGGQRATLAPSPLSPGRCKTARGWSCEGHRSS